jgi:nucleotide-binding universal stress UspA family protein
MDFQRTSVVIAIDNAGNAGRALDYGLALAEALRLPVRLVHVATIRDQHTAGVRRIDLKEIENAADGIPEYEIAAGLLDQALARAGDRQVDIEPVLLGGDPADALLRYLNECDRPMLVMGRRGQSQIQALLLGSVSDKIVRHATCPVIVVS